jgi:predicted site-specific integrase-resolvase
MDGVVGIPVQLKLLLLPLEDTLDVFSAARVAKVSPSTLRRWCELGFFPCYKLVGNWRIERESFYEWIRSKRISPSE